MLFVQAALVLVLAVNSSLAYESAEAQYVRRAVSADPQGLIARRVRDHLSHTREIGAMRQAFDLDIRGVDFNDDVYAIRRSDDSAPKSLSARAGGAAGGGGKSTKSKGSGPAGNCRQACKFCKDKKGGDGKPCAYVDVVAPPGVDKKRFDKCKEQLAQNAGVNPGGMGAVSAGGGLGGAMAIAITGSITDKLTKGTCSGVYEQVQAGVSSGGGQCC
ncbi:hypothetical protein MMC13_001135 [Lambiella insularis]|nr:hypothetical protein [Lambiella insularis]